MRLLPILRVSLCALSFGACGSGSGGGASSSPSHNKQGVIPEVPVEPATPASPEAPQATPEFPRSAATSYFQSEAARDALRLFRWQEFDRALVVTESAEARAEGSEKRALGLLRARILRALNRETEAAEGYLEAARHFPLAADYLHYEASSAFGRAKDARAKEVADKVPADSPWAQERDFLVAESALAKNEMSKAVELYTAYLRSNPEHLMTKVRLHEVFTALGESAKAAKLAREIAVSDPTSAFAEARRKEIAQMSFTAPELMERGMAFFQSMRNADAERTFAKALREDLSAQDKCSARYHRAKSVFKDRKYSRTIPLFEAALSDCEGVDTHWATLSAYHLGLASSRRKKHAEAVRYFEKAETFSEHSYADDARLRQAEEHQSLGNDERARELLASLPERFPEGDMIGESLWRLARAAYFDGEYARAVSWLEKQVEVIGVEHRWWAEGQALYWLGRSHGKLGNKEEATEYYQRCIREYPLTFYSLQAFQRLREIDEALFFAMEKEVQGAQELGPRLSPNARYAEVEFRRALELARLALPDPTRRQLESMGLRVPKGRAQETDPDKLEDLLLQQRLLDLSGNYPQSHWVGRWHNIDYRRRWPGKKGDEIDEAWQLAYPFAYWDLLQHFAGRYTYPAHLQMAIVREESAFDPKRESWANAVGLTQMIFPTAIDHAKGSGIAVNRANLQHPVKNVTIGSHFLQSLQDAFEGRVGLMVPGYNAGRARVRGWIRSNRGYDLDEWIELIKGDQARRYSKRVLGSYFTYVYLDERRIPEMRNEVPLRLGRRP